MNKQGSLIILGLFFLGAHGAPIDGFDWHFNKFGVKLDFWVKDTSNPLVGGKTHVELPISAVWNLLEQESMFLKPFMIKLEETTFGKLYDLAAIKMDIAYEAEHILEGVYNVVVDYVLVHKDGTEEKATMTIAGKKIGSEVVTTITMTPFSVMGIKITKEPVKVISVCEWSTKTHMITVTGEFGKIGITMEYSMAEISATAVWEHLGHQYKYSSVLSLKEKFFTITWQHPTEQPRNLVVKYSFVDGMDSIVITGYVPATQWFSFGEFKTKIESSRDLFCITHTFNGLEILKFQVGLTSGKIFDAVVRYGSEISEKFHLIMECQNNMFKIRLPLKMNYEIMVEFQPTNEAMMLEGGNLKLTVIQNNKELLKGGCFIGLTKDLEKVEFLIKNGFLTVLDASLKEILITEANFTMKLFIDLKNKTGLLPKFSLSTNLDADKQNVFGLILSTVDMPYRLRVFCPYLIKNVLKMSTLEYLEITQTTVMNGEKTVTVAECNFTQKKLRVTMTPTLLCYELMDGNVVVAKYANDMKVLQYVANAFHLEGQTNFFLHETSYLHKVLCELTDKVCFKDVGLAYHIETVDIMKGMMKIMLSVSMDNQKVVLLNLNTVEAPKQLVLEIPLMALEAKVVYAMDVKEFQIWITKGFELSSVILKPTGENIFHLEMNGIPLLEFVVGNKMVTISAFGWMKENISAVLTWRTLSLFENTVGLQILMKKSTHNIVYGWNFNMLKKAFIDFKMFGTGAYIIGDYEVGHHVNWNIKDLKNIDLFWTGKVHCTEFTILATPALTDAHLMIKDYVIDMKLVETIASEVYTFIMRTHPFKLALLPFFEYPITNLIL